MENIGYTGLSGNLSGLSYTYIYDALGNIAAMTPSTGNSESYTYDAMGQLTGAAIGETSYSYTYDGAGNILTAQEGDVTNTYTYGNENWKDLLTAYNGQLITYEGQTVTDGVVSGTPTSGNPIRYNNGTQWGFSWSDGRNLSVASKSGSSVVFLYDASGIRTQKRYATPASGRTSTYLYAGGKLLRETMASSYTHGPSSNVILDFAYDASGLPYSLTYNNGNTTATYYYITNLQGDVMYLVDGTGAEVAAYTYDPYGKVLTATGSMAGINPLRYRGYYQDSETGFYYLQSRYYDPEVGRFINADSYASTGQGLLGYNMFSYCGNNPVRYADPTGHYKLQAAVEMLLTWLTGDGSTQYYSKKSRITKQLKKSKKMQSFVDVAINNYKNGESTTTGQAEFTSEEDGNELYLSTQHFDYTITVEKETRRSGILFGRHDEMRYTATVTVYDTYNFDSMREWEGFGNIMNNLAIMYDIFVGGHDYKWYATYTYSTSWEDVT